MDTQKKVTGVVLAGGLARRMQQRDKGLLPYRGKAMVCHALKAMDGVADEIFINANRNIERYRAFGYPVIRDLNDAYEGPLAGILAALTSAQTEIVLAIPCDSPLIASRHLRKLLAGLHQEGAEIAVAFDGERLHPVFLALKTTLRDSLRDYLLAGERKVEKWLYQHRTVRVDFSREAEVFVNLNTPDDLFRMEESDDN